MSIDVSPEGSRAIIDRRSSATLRLELRAFFGGDAGGTGPACCIVRELPSRAWRPGARHRGCAGRVVTEAAGHGAISRAAGSGVQPTPPRPATQGRPTLERMDPNGPEAQRLFKTLVAHHVAITSTLPVFEHSVPGRPPLEQRVLDVMTPAARDAYLYSRNRRAAAADNGAARLFKRDMDLEKQAADRARNAPGKPSTNN